MIKYLTQFLRYGKLIGKDGKIYENLDYPRGQELDTLRVVSYDNSRRYELLRAWSNNRQLTDEEREEMKSYILTIPCSEVEPYDDIRFIDSHYNDKFYVKNLSEIVVNGTVYLAVRDDEYHTTLYRKKEDGRYTYARCYHICEMGEVAERNGWVYYPNKEVATA